LVDSDDRRELTAEATREERTGESGDQEAAGSSDEGDRQQQDPTGEREPVGQSRGREDELLRPSMIEELCSDGPARCGRVMQAARRPVASPAPTVRAASTTPMMAAASAPRSRHAPTK